jgi:hypothetical protein
MNIRRPHNLFLALAAILLLSACRTDDYIVYTEDEDTGVKAAQTEVVGMYLLNEGNMGSNKCTLDYLDLSGSLGGTIHYLRNIYAERNPNEVKELGDVGNDIQVYSDQLWIVVNCSHKVEVCRAADAVKIAKIDVPNCRNVVFADGYAYVSSYVGPVAVSGDAPQGRVYKIDTRSFQIVGTVTVGYQPEEMAVVGQKLYVANSGGYRAPDYDRTVSVVDLPTFTEERKIDVAVNLQRCEADRYGQVWVSSRGDYFDNPSLLCWLQPDANGSMQKAGQIDVPVSEMCIVGDSLYYIGVSFNYNTMRNEVSFGIVNVRSHQVVTTQLTPAAEALSMTLPYGIIVNPYQRDFYLMDAKDYVSSGELLHFRADGTFDYRVWTGDIPAHAVFIFKKTEQQ